MQNFNFDYDAENDDLFLFNPKSKSKGSVELGDIVLDYNGRKELVGIQVINASRMIKDLTGENLSTIRELLASLVKCKIDVKPKKNLLIIKLFLFSKIKDISPVINVPSIVESSPALASA